MKRTILLILQEIRPDFTFLGVGNFIEDGMLDSFDIVTLVTSLDNKFNISIEGLDILPENFKSVESIISLLKKYGVTDES